MDARLDQNPNPTGTEISQLLPNSYERRKFGGRKHPNPQPVTSTEDKTTCMELNENRMTSATAVPIAVSAKSIYLTSTSSSNGAKTTPSLGESTVEPVRMALRVPEDRNSTASRASSAVLPIDSAASSPLSPSPQQALATSPELLFSLSPEELDHAKSLVLDLLGVWGSEGGKYVERYRWGHEEAREDVEVERSWGVDPEYLIESGVSAEVLFRVFTDLNLRLPKNLVVSKKIEDVAYSWGPRPSECPQNS